MITEVRLPKLGKTMEEATVVEYLVKLGDKVRKGDCIFEIETDKATMEIESPADGFVKRILAEIGQTLPVGQAVLVLAEKDEKVPKNFLDSLSRPKPSAQVPSDVQAEPSAVDAAAEHPGPAAAPKALSEVKLGDTIPLGRLAKITAEKMLRSKRQIPCFYLTVRADVTELAEFRENLNKKGDAKVSYNDFIIKAVAAGLEKFPIMTGQLAGDAIKLADSIGIGLAISVPGGLAAPIVKDVNKKTLARIACDTKDLAEKARNNKLAPADLEQGCITISNLGAFGVESFIPIVVPGQCSILGVGKIVDTCIPNSDGFTVRRLMTMTLSVDHRVTDGAYATQFLDFVRKALENTSNFT